MKWCSQEEWLRQKSRWRDEDSSLDRASHDLRYCEPFPCRQMQWRRSNLQIRAGIHVKAVIQLQVKGRWGIIAFSTSCHWLVGYVYLLFIFSTWRNGLCTEKRPAVAQVSVTVWVSQIVCNPRTPWIPSSVLWQKRAPHLDYRTKRMEILDSIPDNSFKKFNAGYEITEQVKNLNRN